MSDRQDIENRIQDYLDGRMDTGERAAFEQQLEGDAGLRARVRELQAAGDALRSDAALPAGFHARARERFEQSRSPRRKVAARGFPTWQFAGVAASLLLVGVLFYPQLTNILEGNAPVPTASEASAFSGESAAADRSESFADSDTTPSDDAELRAGEQAPGRALEKRETSSKPSPPVAPEPADEPAPTAAAPRKRTQAAMAEQEAFGAKELTAQQAGADEKKQDAAKIAEPRQAPVTDGNAAAASGAAASESDEVTETSDELVESLNRDRFRNLRTPGMASSAQPVVTRSDKEAEAREKAARMNDLGYIQGVVEEIMGRTPLPAGVAVAGEVRLIQDEETWKALAWDDWSVDFSTHSVVLLGPRTPPLDCDGVVERLEGDRLTLVLLSPGDALHGCAIEVDRRVQHVEVLEP
ncbi:hypothetical protein ABI59_21020 [Acidobacteria bacterium Mor1]|nr:hypothetical protein ABI59_21020 [Acidobacteria bacterium Mor1]